MEPAQSFLRVTPEKYIDMVIGSGVPFTLKLENVVDKPVAFKIKTTAPKSYLVRPSTGVIPQGEAREVQILYQQNQASLDGSTDRANDRFLIQSISIDSPEPALEKDFWTHCQRNQKSDMRDHRLAVVFRDQLGVVLNRPSASASAAPGMNPSVEASTAGSIPAVTTTTTTGVRGVGFVTNPTIVQGGQVTQEKYQELVNYTVSLEHAKKQLSISLEQAEKKVAELSSQCQMQELHDLRTTAGNTNKGTSGINVVKHWKHWQVVLVAVVALFIGRWTA